MPEPGVERTLDRSSGVSALVGDAADCVFLLERESSGQRSEPGADSGEGGAARWCVVLWRRTRNELERAPADGAVRLVDEPAELLYAVLSNKCIRVLRAGEQLGLEHAKCRRFLGAACAFNCSCCSLAPRCVVVECEYDRVEAKALESCDGSRLEAGAAGGSDVGESLGLEVVNVEKAFDQHELASLGRGLTEHLG